MGVEKRERFTPTERVCARCKETKAAAEFGNDRRKPDGLKSYCRLCESEYAQERYRSKPPTKAQRERHSARNNERKEQRGRLCANCSNPAEPGKAKCASHLRAAVESVRKVAIKRVASGFCGRCGKNAIIAPARRCEECLVRQRSYFSSNKHRIAKPTKEHANKIAKARYARIRLKVWDAYGGRFCACCGEDVPEFLTIDHENGDGAAHRKEILGSRVASMVAWLYSELIKGRKHPGLRVYCYNCNAGAWRNGGTCPHQTLKQKLLYA